MDENYNSEIKANIIDFFNGRAEECIKLLRIADSPDIERIYEFDNNIIPNELESLFEQTEILILTANKYETNILHHNIAEKLRNSGAEENKKIRKIMLKTFGSNHFFYFFEWGNYKAVHIMAETTGSNTVGGAEDMIRMAFQYRKFQPMAVISFGICFGINHKTQRLGNVIISEKLYSYGVGLKLKEDKIVISDDNNFVIHDLLRNNVRELKNQSVISENQGEYVGNYITGEAVMSSESLKQKVVQSATVSQVMAGEMEGYGIFKECVRYGRDGKGKEKVPCIIIKAICDWGAQKNGFLNTLDDGKMDMQKTAGIFAIADENINYVKSYLKESGIDYEPSSAEIEEVVKNSIQAFAADRAFRTSDKLFNNKMYFFGRTLYLKAYDFISMYLQDGNSTIFRSTLVKSMDNYFEDITEEEIDNLIKQLCNNGILRELESDNLLKICG